MEREFPQYRNFIAAGLVGEGSECFGYDDRISEDHDYGAGFCIWLPDEIYEKAGHRMQQAYDALAEQVKVFAGQPVISGRAAGGSKRKGVFSIEEFYRGLLGDLYFPQKEEDWFLFSESALAAATNGDVFADPAGFFSSVRKKLQVYYPENVRLKKISVCLLYMAQTGQVNYARCMARGERLASGICISEFMRAALSVLYLLNRRYMPFYKWAPRGLKNAAVLSDGILILEKLQTAEEQEGVWKMAGVSDSAQRQVCFADGLNTEDKKVCLIEKLCSEIVQELHRQRITDSSEVFLTMQAESVHKHISNPEIRKAVIRMPEYQV